MHLFFTLLILISSPVYADPWGKDADLARPYHENKKTCSTSPVEPLVKGLIRFHQQVISPCDGPRSHFIPSSSQYAFDAIQQYGFLTGFGMGCDRLMRENKEEWVYHTTVDGAGCVIKYDPVPAIPTRK